MIDRQRIDVFPLLARTTDPASVKVDARCISGIIIYLSVTARGAASGGLTPRISGRDAVGNKIAFWTAAAALATASGQAVYIISPHTLSAASGPITEVLQRPIPREFFVDVAHGDSTSYTYALTIETY